MRPQFDLSYEYYFGSQGLVSVTPFWKEVDSFVTVVTQSIFVVDQAGGREGPVTVPINGEGGTIKGIELQRAVRVRLGHRLQRQLHVLGLRVADLQ